MSSPLTARRDTLSVAGAFALLVAVVLAGFVVAELLMVQFDVSTKAGLAHFAHQVGHFLAAPTKDLFHARKPKSTVLANESIAAAGYLALGLLVRQLLR